MGCIEERSVVSSLSVTPSATFPSAIAKVLFWIILSSVDLVQASPPVLFRLFTFYSRSTPEVHTVCAFFPVRTESRKVKLANIATHMTLIASRTFLTEAGVVVFAQWKLRVFLDMDIKALVSILAVSILIIELAFAHLAQIIFVQVVALVAFFT